MRICENEKVLVLADDFTGANDAGVCLAEVGMRVDVVLSADYRGEAQALIFNSDSRALPASDAAQKVESLLAVALAHFHPRWVVKKIDSTLRGNPGAEIAAMMHMLDCKRAIVAPAFPAAGRVTREGRCYVHNKLLTDTEFASDPKTPVSDADIAALIRQQSSLLCHHTTADGLGLVLHQDADQSQALIVDAQSDGELDAIVEAIAQSSQRILLVGSAGICDALARYLAARRKGPLLAVVGSMSEIAQQQIAALEGYPHLRRISIDVEKAFSEEAEIDARGIASALNRGEHCVVTTTADVDARRRIDALCRRYGLNHAELGEQICRYLARVVQLALNASQPAALYLSGGDVAIAIANALKATGFQITGRVAECVPYGHFLGSRWQRPVMTKAGGFGSATTLRDVVEFIEEKMSD